MAIVDRPTATLSQPSDERIPTIQLSDLNTHRESPTVSARLARIAEQVKLRQGRRYAEPPSR